MNVQCALKGAPYVRGPALKRRGQGGGFEWSDTYQVTRIDERLAAEWPGASAHYVGANPEDGRLGIICPTCVPRAVALGTRWIQRSRQGDGGAALVDVDGEDELAWCPAVRPNSVQGRLDSTRS